MSTDGRGARRAAGVLLAAGVAVAGALAATACASAGDGAGGDHEGDTSSATADGGPGGRDSPTTEPSGRDPEAVTGYVEDLLRRYDAAVNAIIADPAVVRDRTDPLVAEYVGLFEPDSTVADEALAGWADAGTTVRPLNASTPMIASRLDGALEVVDDDEVGFATCAAHHYVLYDGQGAVQDVVDRVGQAGQGVAVRIDGRWHLRGIELRDDRPACATAAATTDGPGAPDAPDTGGAPDTTRGDDP
jgi:hypothetical protein